MSLPEVRMSVRAVVETTLHDSDLCPAGSAMRRMREGTVAHRARQSAAQEEERVYRAEVALHASYRTPELVLRVSGRADGILTGADGAVIIEEIKLGAADAPLLPAHRAQPYTLAEPPSPRTARVITKENPPCSSISAYAPRTRPI